MKQLPKRFATLASIALLPLGIWILQTQGNPLDVNGPPCLDPRSLDAIERKAKDQNPHLFERLHANAVVCGSQKEVEGFERDGVVYGNPRFLMSHARKVFEISRGIDDPKLSLEIMDLASLRVEQVIALSRSNGGASDVRAEAQDELVYAEKLSAEIQAAKRQIAAQLRLE
ncbi:hypothetical protein [Sphingopyxis sp. KK2]|uniref:hypothetical protein n=1 Tax=Sphingopyxis sp. KK2 TaxID=1855727 RepID=UPI001181C1C2|nr:hypothetical protein [Sphingopyxis sp. KK2]